MDIDLDKPSRPQLSALLGVSSRWVGELRSKGDLPADGASWGENLEAWILLKTQTGSDDGDALDLDVERARLAHEQANAKAMDNAERRKELASLPDMTMAVSGVITLAVARLMQVPARVAKSNATLRRQIEIAIVDALQELSVARVQEVTGGGTDDEDAPESPDG